MLIALDKLTVELHASELCEGGAMIYDSNKVKDAESLAKRKDIDLIGAPLTQMAAQAGGEIMFNTVALGAAMGLLQLDFAILENMLTKIWASKGQKVVDANVAAAKAGYEFSKSALTEPFKIKIEFVKREKTMFINGNEAAVVGRGEGRLQVRGRIPDEPLLLHTAPHGRPRARLRHNREADRGRNRGCEHDLRRCLRRSARHDRHFGRRLRAHGRGAWHDGHNGGPVRDFRVAALRPLHRPSDLHRAGRPLFALHASQGEFPRVVIAPGDPAECYVEAVNAFNIAEHGADASHSAP